MNPDKNAYINATEEHDRGAVLVAAVMTASCAPTMTRSRTS